MTHALRICLTMAILFLSSLPALAQQTVQLIADSVHMDGSDILIAQGNVEVFYGTKHLQAQSLRYNDTTGRLQVEGPMILTDGGSTQLIADSAELSADLRDGLLNSARMVIDQQLQIAAAEIRHANGRYTQFSKTVASSCYICANSTTPLWEIRSDRVVHDRQEQQLYFDHAQLRLLGIPIFYAPRLRLPDPTLKRATGFLPPSLRSTSQLGTGVKAPYFIRIGDHRDLTLTPYLSGSTTTLEYRYRQAFQNGEIEVNGAVSDDDIRPNDLRSYVFVDGQFDLRNDYKLAFDLEYSSDDAYLLDYGYSDKDRLDSQISVSKNQRNLSFETSLTHYKSLRDSEVNSQIPSLIGYFSRRTRFQPRLLGGQALLTYDGLLAYRQSGTSGDLGRDVGRASASFDWRKDWTFDGGLQTALLSEVRLDYYGNRQGFAVEENGIIATGTVGAELHLPMARTGNDGSHQLLEPVAQVLWTTEDDQIIANEDSQLVEFDEGNLFAFSRFTGADRIERGLRANLGATWTRYDPGGWSSNLTFGRVIRSENLSQFTQGTGLDGVSSDWIMAAQFNLPGNLTVANRALFDDSFNFNRSESRINWHSEQVSLAATYVWLESAPAENRPQISEWAFDSTFDLGQGWRGKLDLTHDFIADQTATAGVGLVYESECILVDLSLSRRFTRSDTLNPTTDFGLSISLTGFGNRASNRSRANQCRS